MNQFFSFVNSNIGASQLIKSSFHVASNLEIVESFSTLCHIRDRFSDGLQCFHDFGHESTPNPSHERINMTSEAQDDDAQGKDQTEPTFRRTPYEGAPDEDVWRLVSTIFDMHDDESNFTDHWYDTLQGTALLLFAVHVLAKEFRDEVEDLSTRPLLVQKIVQLTMSRADDIRPLLLRALL